MSLDDIFPSLFSHFRSNFMTDIDECVTTPGTRHVNATCNNTHGSYVCKRKPGYTGDGQICTGTVTSLRILQIFDDYYNEFLFSLILCLVF